MTNTQRLTIRASEIRQRLNEIAGLATDALTDVIRTETDTLANEFRDTETQLRAALTAEGESGTQTRIVVEDAEARERRTLRAKTGIGDFLAAAAGKRDVTGPAAEYRDSLKVDRQGPGGGVLMPIDVFEQYRPETRAVTPGVTAVQTAAPTVPYVFERSALASLGFVLSPAGRRITRLSARRPRPAQWTRATRRSRRRVCSGSIPGSRNGSPGSSKSGRKTPRYFPIWIGRCGKA